MKRITEDPSATQHISLSQSQQAELRTDSVGEKLNVMISNLPTSGVSLAEIRDIVGRMFIASHSVPCNRFYGPRIDSGC